MKIAEPLGPSFRAVDIGQLLSQSSETAWYCRISCKVSLYKHGKADLKSHEGSYTCFIEEFQKSALTWHFPQLLITRHLYLEQLARDHRGQLPKHDVLSIQDLHSDGVSQTSHSAD